jgi:AraC-like DNA-binding protein
MAALMHINAMNATFIADTGYDNASSFATMFRRVTGQPPSFYHPA